MPSKKSGRPEIRTKIKAMLGRVDKQLNQAEGPLSQLWCMILGDLNIDFDRWNRLMMSYLYTLSKDGNTPVNKMADERGNMTKALTASRLSLLVFLRGLKLLQTEAARFEVTLFFPDGEKLVQSTEIQFDTGGEIIAGVKDKVPVPPPELPTFKKRFFRSASPSPFLGDAPHQKPINAMLEDNNKLAHKATGILSKLWRQILTSLDVDTMQWNNAVVAYLLKCNIEEGTLASKERSNIRGNLNKELVKKNMSIWVFLKAMAFLNVESFDLVMYLKRRGSLKTTMHKIHYNTPPPEEIYKEQKAKRG